MRAIFLFFAAGVILGVLVAGLAGFYVDPGCGLIGSDYFFFDLVNMDYCLTGGL